MSNVDEKRIREIVREELSEVFSPLACIKPPKPISRGSERRVVALALRSAVQAVEKSGGHLFLSDDKPSESLLDVDSRYFFSGIIPPKDQARPDGCGETVSAVASISSTCRETASSSKGVADDIGSIQCLQTSTAPVAVTGRPAIDNVKTAFAAIPAPPTTISIRSYSSFVRPTGIVHILNWIKACFCRESRRGGKP
ncbi:hypothetical protein GRI33_06210 [Brucella sp. BO3]|uniref:hypothetical protein n=1 Tax=unclassified Brucella TaxID=2632610 RepID=UPI00114D2A80|nr:MULTISPECIES: hypothetical protein [unclassified Brucella]QMV26543.1 hypothetical protein GRI33_06210 [Brucella sp. BO3]